MEQEYSEFKQSDKSLIGLNLKIMALTCAGIVVAFWSLTQYVAGLSPFTVITNVITTRVCG